MKKLLFKLLFRNFLKDKLLNTVNILGLSLGLVATLLIALYADHELSHDRFHEDADNIYRIEAITNGDLWFSNLGMEHGKELKGGVYPEVKRVVQVNTQGRLFLEHNGRKLSQDKILQVPVGAEFFKIFSFNTLLGNPDRLLDEPYATVLTAKAAKKHFGDLSPIGSTLTRDSISYKVTGVIEDLPTNSHLDFEMIFANPSRSGDRHYHTQTYIQLENDAKPAVLEEKIMGMPLELDEFHTLTQVRLMPLPDIYFKSESVFGSGGKGDTLQLTIFVIVGILILLIAVANYINLSLAIYSSKGLEIGMRKVLGESKRQIMRAFITDAVLMTMCCIPLAILGLYLSLPLFNNLMEVQLENKLLALNLYWPALLAVVVIVSILTVIYPATILNGTKISDLIKSKAALSHKGGIRLRNALIFFQFILLFTLGISAWFMNRQISYLDHKDMGFDASDVIKVSNAFEIGQIQNYELLKSELLNSPLIAGVSFGPMIGDGMNPLAYKAEGSEQVYENLLSYGVDVDYFDVMGIDITAGDFKSVLRSSESGQITSLVNQSFVNRYGWQDDPIGKKITLRPGSENALVRTVSAVFEDFHYFSLKEKVTPQIISLRPDPQFVNTNLLIKSATPDLKAAAALVTEKWDELVKSTPIELDYMDDAVKRLYAREKRTGQVTVTFSILAVALSLSGLIGFMVYIIGLKSKEIAVRKVLGASLIQIIGLLNRQLFLAILFAAFTGSGLSYWLVSTWLRDYAYAISLSPMTFVLSAALVYLIVFLITGLQSVKSAQTNPVMALKHE